MLFGWTPRRNLLTTRLLQRVYNHIFKPMKVLIFIELSEH
uniref:Uncharacterized protein n=1 Tax=Rhizophora mucronata TaxID=61149 RepID=A0A2P2N4Z1_RHIMU